jgi:hypothetical protein
LDMTPLSIAAKILFVMMEALCKASCAARSSFVEVFVPSRPSPPWIFG